MSKAVLISIRPKWCEKIASGEKTIEVRKTRPNLPTPFKCYIYCTIDGIKKMPKDYIAESVERGKVIGEFTCERIALIAYDGGELSSTTNAAFSSAMCLTLSESIAYIGDKGRCYGWHISDLRIYDPPKELSEFTGLRDTKFGAAPYEIKRPPQSWCYVEAMKDG